ncbi:MAG: preprotein translocase subunit YajC [Porticoccaceae bacterium]|nr:preprotein translocase subunit YajC [Porticoccaceae bacterium]|tara:strand:+ start:3939 stop:4268 length:330 start_codon:yes stop_codon:yes gene_type:complete
MLFVENVQAQASAAAGEPNLMFQLLLFGGLFGLMYFMIIRPQRKRQKAHNDLLLRLAKGDEVLMTSGLLGKIVKLDGDYVVLDVAESLQLKFQKSAVHAVLPKGTFKAI